MLQSHSEMTVGKTEFYLDRQINYYASKLFITKQKWIDCMDNQYSLIKKRGNLKKKIKKRGNFVDF